MKRLARPELDSLLVFDACVSGITDDFLNAKFSAAKKEMEALIDQYRSKGELHQLHSFQASKWGGGDQLVLGGVTKDEFVDLYSKHMVGDGKPGRKYYEHMMLTAPLGKCPYCGFGQVSTLDHFLPKARYPSLSVLPENLVPSCGACNKGKGSSVVTEKNQSLHPYFESDLIEKEAWLFAEILESNPVTVKFLAMPPASWSDELRNRVNNFFGDFDLARRFAIEAAGELVTVCDVLDLLNIRPLKEMYISSIAQVERSNRTNSWKAALYDALSRSDWFISGGYMNPPQLTLKHTVE